MRPWLGIHGTILGAALYACSSIPAQDTLPTATAVDLTRYAGTWYEIARLPLWFQRHCLDSKAVYSIRTDGKVDVHNECFTDEGRTDEANGVATVVDPKTNAKLRVVFDNWFARAFGASRDGNYWIIELDAEYRFAMVGTPDRRHLWILSRSPSLAEVTYAKLVERAATLGFPISDLIRDTRPSLHEEQGRSCCSPFTDARLFVKQRATERTVLPRNHRLFDIHRLVLSPR
ncbi:hypothetical protein W02_17190 [Nitrospira sp. KM1]|uniref:lipocalin family protein n=1 Tax=Nitrospira sp. KM1 TaxID=1936990 RepID=UPI0013A76DB5|nr:lipocalin family protein [Nitrospira sp. KM1]BCA54579.1 hypothetical protein W02_17190 [Nitrospira sp. KM1]